ncbi:MAG TPA: LysM peptidoglycan-binding domain-containing protein [Longimicrobium sp.]|jgi:membrane-bound lytic murein transglycosylase D|uniref:LysM peptidoglycan-binding domain-containing protein n=1 Tax=Longimicrobium sp. TaxID=2029185 RepID=UPI002ED91C01
MRRIALLVLVLALAAPEAAAQGTPNRRPPRDTIRFAEPAPSDSTREDEADEDEAAADTAAADSVPRPGPFSRDGGRGPFSVQASGQVAPRPPRGEIVWLETAPAPRVASSDTAASRRTSARDTARTASGRTASRDTASTRRASTGQTGTTRTSTGQTTRRDTASTGSRTASRDNTSTRRTGTAPTGTTRTNTGQTARRDTASAGSRTASRDTASQTRTASRDTASRRTGTTTPAGGRTTTGSGATTPANRPAQGSTSATRRTTHTVAAGETFFGIARRYGVTAAQLRAMNPDVDWESVEVGEVLRLPATARDSRASGSGQGTATQPQTPAASRTPNRTGSRPTRTHTVAPGETLFGIARRYGVTRQDIIDANDLESDQLRTGQRLTIPPPD